MVPVLLLALGCGQVGLEDMSEDPLEEGRLVIEPAGQVRFDTASPYGRSVAATVTVKAAGDAPVRVVDGWTEGYPEGAFTLPTAPFPKKLDPGQSVDLELRFLPPGDGAFEGLLVLETEGGALAERTLVGNGCRDADQDGDC